MKKILLILLCHFLISCGDYVEKKITLDSTQETAISNYLTTECVNKNAALFNSLLNNTGNWQNNDIQEEFIYEYETTNKDTKQIIILKNTTSLMYIYVQSTDAEVNDRVYKYTTTDNTNHLNALKSTACNAKNTFTGDANSFSYTANFNDPDDEDEDRIEYSSQYTVAGNRPVFFSLFNRKYNRKRYEDDKVKDTIDTTVSIKITDTRRADDLEDYRELFDDSDHCVFDTTGASWLGANFPDTLTATMNDSPCAQDVFTWSTDILGN
jgi:hypothetical protein